MHIPGTHARGPNKPIDPANPNDFVIQVTYSSGVWQAEIEGKYLHAQNRHDLGREIWKQLAGHYDIDLTA